jgi:hypothetical protein
MVSNNYLFDSECIDITSNIAPCSRVSAAPKGTIDVTFKKDKQIVSIVIVAVAPNTQIKLTCTAIPKGGALEAKTVK